MSRRRRTVSIIILSVCVLAAGAAFIVPEMVSRAGYRAEAREAIAAREELTTVQDLSSAFKTVAKSMRPSVVNISTVKRVQTGFQRRPGTQDEGGPGGGSPPAGSFATASGVSCSSRERVDWLLAGRWQEVAGSV